jgi:hypothetical protein
MLLLKHLKDKAAAFCGDTSGSESILYRDHLTDFANYAVRDVEQEVRLKCKHKDFFYREFVIATDTDGTGGDYALPLDFGAVLPKFGVRLVQSGLTGTIEGVGLHDFQKLFADGPYGRTVYTIHGKPPQRYIRFTPAPLATGLTFTVCYDAKNPKLISDNDPIITFPEDDGWEPILIMRMATYAYRYHQAQGIKDPTTEFKVMLEEKIISMNGDAPNSGGQPIHMDDVDAAYRHLERGGWSPSGGQ